MKISAPKQFTEIGGRSSALYSPISDAVKTLKPGEVIEITDPPRYAASNALYAARRCGFKITTRKTTAGALHIYRIS